jgi:hypothetical protein
MPGADTEGEGVKPQDPKDGEGANPQDPQEGTKPQEGAEGEGAKPQDPDATEGATVNRHQYERDVERRDKRIAELEAQLKAQNDAKAAKGDETAQLRKEIEDFKSQLADEKLNTELTAAGCIDAKAAKACLEDYDGDVDKLKEAKPYLFHQAEKKHLSTGGKPAGSATTEAKSIKEGLASRT